MTNAPLGTELVSLESPFANEAASAGLNGGPKAAPALQAAGRKVMASNAAAKTFRTLRDLKVDWFIPPSALETIGKLGEGAFASVDKAWYTAPDGSKTVVAVKRLKPEILAKPVDYELFVEETQLMKKLKHKNIVMLVGVGELDTANVTNAYMVQEFMGGGTLKRLVTEEMLLNGRRGYSNADAISICLQMAEGLAYLHGCHPMVIHRDLKLENVLLSSSQKVDGMYEVKLADFGLSTKVTAKMQRLRSMKNCDPGLPFAVSAPAGTSAAQQQEENWNKLMRTYSSHRTKSYTNLQGLQAAPSLPREPSTKYELTGQTGSLMYMSPEVFNQQRYNEKADVFSFGMMMYEVMQRYVTINMVSLKGTYEELFMYAARVAAGYRPPINPKLPQQVISLIKACWAENPSDRPHMTQVVALLQQALAQEQAAEAAKPQAPGCSCTIS